LFAIADGAAPDGRGILMLQILSNLEAKDSLCSATIGHVFRKYGPR
jgi:hypothetical protein